MSLSVINPPGTVGAGSITSEHLANGAVTEAKLGAASVTVAKLGAGLLGTLLRDSGNSTSPVPGTEIATLDAGSGYRLQGISAFWYGVNSGAWIRVAVTFTDDTTQTLDPGTGASNFLQLTDLGLYDATDGSINVQFTSGKVPKKLVFETAGVGTNGRDCSAVAWKVPV